MTLQSSMGISLEIWGAVISLICIVAVLAQRQIFHRRSVILCLLFLNNAFTLAIDALEIAYRENLIEGLPLGLIKVGYFAEFQLGYLLPLTSILYIDAILMEKGERISKKFLILEALVIPAGDIFLIMTQFNGFYYYFDKMGQYHRNPGFEVSMGLGIFGTALLILAVIRNWKYFEKMSRFSLLLYMVIALAGLMIQTKLGDISFLNIAVTIAFLHVFGAHSLEMTSMLHKQQEIIYRKEQEDAERRYDILKAQVEPHFLFNSLSSICAQCEDENTVALLQNFAKYMRMNLDAINRDENIPFSKELEHVDEYLMIEKLRFEEKLKIRTDIHETDFEIPPLALEILVENAVKHGISKKRGGGTLHIISEKADIDGKMCYRVVVEDDGIGFDPDQKANDNRSHIGLENVRQRLETKVNGSMLIESTPDVGTKITLLIPVADSDKR